MTRRRQPPTMINVTRADTERKEHREAWRAAAQASSPAPAPAPREPEPVAQPKPGPGRRVVVRNGLRPGSRVLSRSEAAEVDRLLGDVAAAAGAQTPGWVSTVRNSLSIDRGRDQL